MNLLLQQLELHLPVTEPVGTMIVDIGGGTTEVAVLSLGGTVVSESLRIAGDEINDSISTILKKSIVWQLVREQQKR